MEPENPFLTTVPIRLPNGEIVQVEVSESGRKDTSIDPHLFDELSGVLEGVTVALSETIKKAKPRKAVIKFGLELAVESGKLTAIVVKGSSKANLEITLEWGT
jgi:hypothetical protein